MIAAALLLLMQAAPAVGNETQARQALARGGLSPAGVELVISSVKRRQPEVRQRLERLRQAARGVQGAAARRPVDVAAVDAALTAQRAAVAGLAQSEQSILVEQLRAASPADRVVLLRRFAAPSARPAAPRR